VDDLNHRRNDKIVANYADDGVIIYSGKFLMSSAQKGKSAINESFDKHFNQFTKDCEPRETYIENIFARRQTDSIAIRFHTKRTNKAGMIFENTGMTRLKGGTVVEVRDFYFDVDTLQKMWVE